MSIIFIIIIIIFDPGTQFPGKKNYAMQRQNTKTSWNGLYSSSFFTKLSIIIIIIEVQGDIIPEILDW